MLVLGGMLFVFVVVGVGLVRVVAVDGFRRLADAGYVGLAPGEGRFVVGAAFDLVTHTVTIPQKAPGVTCSVVD